MSNEIRGTWQATRARAAANAQSLSFVETPVELGNPCARYADVAFDGLDGSRVDVRVLRPAGEGKHPVLLMFHDANRSIRGWHHMTRFVALGFAVVALQSRSGVEGVLVDEPLAVGDGLGIALRVDTCPYPPTTGRVLDATTSSAIEGTLSDALVLVSLLPRLEGLDSTRIVTWGEGLGGGLALAVASLTGSQAACALNPMPAALDKRSALLDMALIAEGLSCPVLMGTCGLDLQASVPAQDAVAQVLTDVQRIVYPRYAHERVNAFEDQMFTFLVSVQNGWH